MKKLYSLTVALILGLGVAYAQDLTLDEVIAKHLKAIGFENLQKVNTIIMSGTMIQNDAMPVKITRMRPDRFFMEFDVADLTAYQAYDGQTAWWTTPWTGNPSPQVMPEDRAKDLRTRADFEGLLVNWKAKGHTVELAGSDTVEKAIVYKLKVTKKEGGIEYLFIDREKFILQKRLYYRTVRGQEVAMENYFRDYRPVQGVLFAFTQDTHFGGQPYNSLQLESIELNKPVDEKIFKMPGK